MSTETETAELEAWGRVRDAMMERWPDLNRGELNHCNNDVDKLVQFVIHRTEASEDEVRSVVEEFAPTESDSVLNRVADVASQQAELARDTVQSAYRQTSAKIAERPAESLLGSFLVGVVLGATVTTLFCTSRRQPTTWDRIKQQKWS